MNIRTKLLYTLVLIILVVPGMALAQRVPRCVSNLNGATDPTNPNIMTATVADYGEIKVYISEHTFFSTNSQYKGTWSCVSNKINFVLDQTVPMPPVTNNGAGNQQQNPIPKTQGQNPIPKTGQTSAPASGATDFNLQVRINNPLKVDTIEGAIQLFMNAVLRIAIPFIVIFFIWSGLSFVLARGNPEKIKTAKNMFWYTIIGTLLILGAWTITNAIIGTVNSVQIFIHSP